MTVRPHRGGVALTASSGLALARLQGGYLCHPVTLNKQLETWRSLFKLS